MTLRNSTGGPELSGIRAVFQSKKDKLPLSFFLGKEVPFLFAGDIGEAVG